jgi:hypothetical protein
LWIWTSRAFICISFILFLSIPFHFSPVLQSALYWVSLSLTQTSTCTSCSMASHVSFEFFLSILIHPQFPTTLPCNINYKIN